MWIAKRFLQPQHVADRETEHDGGVPIVRRSFFFGSGWSTIPCQATPQGWVVVQDESAQGKRIGT
jgi:hypothetical protein